MYIFDAAIFFTLLNKDFQAFRIGLVRGLSSAEFEFLFIVSNLLFFLKNHHLPKFYQ